MEAKTSRNKNNKVFERLYDHSLSKKENHEIRKNLTGFFEVLIQIDQGLKKKEVNDYAN